MDQISEREELINLMENPTMSQTTTSNLHVSAIKDKDLRILIFTATYFVLDGVTLTIRRIEGHLRSRGAKVKICTTVGPDVTEEQLKDVIVVPGIKIPYQQAGSKCEVLIYLIYC